MKKNEVQIVVMTDWDNTVMASAEFLKEVLLGTATRVETEHGLILKKSIPDFQTAAREAILKNHFGEENIHIVEPVFQEEYARILDKQAFTMPMLRGARELLIKLVESGIKTAIVSHYYKGSEVDGVGIETHLRMRHVDVDEGGHKTSIVNSKHLAIVGLNDVEKGLVKPHIAFGIQALNLLEVDTSTPIHMIMLGDGKSSDLPFAKNMDHYLKAANPLSKCDGCLFNATVADHEIFTDVSDVSDEHTVVTGYGKVGTCIRNMLNPGVVPSVAYITSMNKMSAISSCAACPTK